MRVRNTPASLFETTILGTTVTVWLERVVDQVCSDQVGTNNYFEISSKQDETHCVHCYEDVKVEVICSAFVCLLVSLFLFFFSLE